MDYTLTSLKLTLYRGGMPQQHFVYKKHTLVLLILRPSEAMPHNGMTIWLVTRWMVVLPSLFKTAYIPIWCCCCIVTHGSPQTNVQSAVYTSHPTLLLSLQISRAHFPSSLLLFYCWETSMHSITSGAVQMRTKGDRWQRHWHLDLTLWCWTRVNPHTYLLLLVTSFFSVFPCTVQLFQLISHGGYSIIPVGVTTF
jgi:hypothetical protein